VNPHFDEEKQDGWLVNILPHPQDVRNLNHEAKRRARDWRRLRKSLRLRLTVFPEHLQVVVQKILEPYVD
jgi:hypothetical protein